MKNPISIERLSIEEADVHLKLYANQIWKPLDQPREAAAMALSHIWMISGRLKRRFQSSDLPEDNPANVQANADCHATAIHKTAPDLNFNTIVSTSIYEGCNMSNRQTIQSLTKLDDYCKHLWYCISTNERCNCETFLSPIVMNYVRCHTCIEDVNTNNSNSEMIDLCTDWLNLSTVIGEKINWEHPTIESRYWKNIRLLHQGQNDIRYRKFIEYNNPFDPMIYFNGLLPYHYHEEEDDDSLCNKNMLLSDADVSLLLEEHTSGYRKYLSSLSDPYKMDLGQGAALCDMSEADVIRTDQEIIQDSLDENAKIHLRHIFEDGIKLFWQHPETDAPLIAHQKKQQDHSSLVNMSSTQNSNEQAPVCVPLKATISATTSQHEVSSTRDTSSTQLCTELDWTSSREQYDIATIAHRGNSSQTGHCNRNNNFTDHFQSEELRKQMAPSTHTEIEHNDKMFRLYDENVDSFQSCKFYTPNPLKDNTVGSNGTNAIPSCQQQLATQERKKQLTHRKPFYPNQKPYHRSVVSPTRSSAYHVQHEYNQLSDCSGPNERYEQSFQPREFYGNVRPPARMWTNNTQPYTDNMYQHFTNQDSNVFANRNGYCSQSNSRQQRGPSYIMYGPPTSSPVAEQTRFFSPSKNSVFYNSAQQQQQNGPNDYQHPHLPYGNNQIVNTCSSNVPLLAWSM